MVRSILVVCIGNVCRSPMAACLLARDLPACEVSSAGLAPPVGAPADPSAVRLLAREGCNLANHRARAIDIELVAAADLILVMDSEQRDRLELEYPHARGRTYRLCEDVHTDIPDPYGGSQSMFVIVLELIKQGVASWSSQLGDLGPLDRQTESS
ncbi:protein tyrosine phosphatase [Cupriavidus sp. UYMU48A]|nr:protein tyrosine phosphatase [Cupriavidus sp. UYMU48A]